MSSEEWPPPPESIQTPRLLLRRYRLTDAEDVFAYARDPEWGRFMPPVPRLYERQHADVFVAGQVLANWRQEPAWAIEHQGRVVGRVRLRLAPRHGRADLGYSMARWLWGRGLTTEAVSAVIDEAFRCLPLRKIAAGAIAENVGSIRVMQKVDMQRGRRDASALGVPRPGLRLGALRPAARRVGAAGGRCEMTTDDWPPLPESIHTPRLLLRRFRLTDAGDVYAYAQDPDWRRFLQTVPEPYEQRHADTFVASRLLEDWQTRPGWAVEFAGQVVGVVHLWFQREHGRAEFGYTLARWLWGRGLMTEARVGGNGRGVRQAPAPQDHRACHRPQHRVNSSDGEIRHAIRGRAAPAPRASRSGR